MPYTTLTRQAPSKYKQWDMLPYMAKAVSHLETHYRAGLSCKPGARKTSMTLEAFRRLQEAGAAKTMLVVGSLRIVRQVWRQEAAKWENFKHFKFSLIHGKGKQGALSAEADIYLINYEALAWLVDTCPKGLPFDVVVYDELTKMANSRAKRCKAMNKVTAKVPYKWGLTGSLFAKQHMGIFGQQLALDNGAALGKYITHFRDKYFQKDWNGYDYSLLPGAEAKMLEAMAPFWYQPEESEYSQLPPLIDVPHRAQMSKAERKLYDEFKRDSIARLSEATITAENAGAMNVKLSQMANGAIYFDRDGQRQQHDIHSLKLEMLEELLDELQGSPLLCAYEFNSDLKRIQHYFKKRFPDGIPYLGKGTTPKQETEWVEAWNRNEIPLMLAHPASAGHGLNLQDGQATNVAWYSVTWDWELYDQFIRRVRRSGNEQERIFNHLLIVDDTMDEIKLAAIRQKDFTEGYLLTSLKTLLTNEEVTMTNPTKLSRPESSWGQAPAQQAAPEQAAPAGWGQAPAQQTAPEQAAPAGWGRAPAQQTAPEQAAPAGWGQAPAQQAAPEQAAPAGQSEKIRETIAPDDDAAKTLGSAFSSDISDMTAKYKDVNEPASEAAPDTKPGSHTAQGPVKKTKRSSSGGAKAKDIRLSLVTTLLSCGVSPAEVPGAAGYLEDYVNGD